MTIAEKLTIANPEVQILEMLNALPETHIRRTPDNLPKGYHLSRYTTGTGADNDIQATYILTTDNLYNTPYQMKHTPKKVSEGYIGIKTPKPKTRVSIEFHIPHADHIASNPKTDLLNSRQYYTNDKGVFVTELKHLLLLFGHTSSQKPHLIKIAIGDSPNTHYFQRIFQIPNHINKSSELYSDVQNMDEIFSEMNNNLLNFIRLKSLAKEDTKERFSISDIFSLQTFSEKDINLYMHYLINISDLASAPWTQDNYFSFMLDHLRFKLHASETNGTNSVPQYFFELSEGSINEPPTSIQFGDEIVEIGEAMKLPDYNYEVTIERFDLRELADIHELIAWVEGTTPNGTEITFALPVSEIITQRQKQSTKTHSSRL